MNHTLSFTTPVGFNYATVVAEVAPIDSTVDKINNLIWVNDLTAALKSFDDAGLDEDDLKVVQRPKGEYDALVERLASEAAAAVAQPSVQVEESDDLSDEPNDEISE